MRKINRPTCPNRSALATNYKVAENKQALVEASFGKCMYCEEKIMSSQFGDVEHIKPKAKYPNLKFEWDNLGLVCTKCNNAKSDKYDESLPFIDPYQEDPENNIIALGAFIVHKKGSEVGENTITEIELNREDLLEKRQERIKKINKSVDACFRTKNVILKNNALEALKDEAAEDKEFSLCIKSLLSCHDI